MVSERVVLGDSLMVAQKDLRLVDSTVGLLGLSMVGSMDYGMDLSKAAH